MKPVMVSRVPIARRLDLLGDCWLECPLCNAVWQVRRRGPIHAQTRRMLEMHVARHREGKPCRATN